VHSLFVISGRVDSSGSAAACTAVQEDFTTQFRRGNVSLRIPTPTYGLGLVENIPDTTLTANLATNAQQKAALGISGHLNTNGNDGPRCPLRLEGAKRFAVAVCRRGLQRRDGYHQRAVQTERDLNPDCQELTVPNDISGKNGIADADEALSDIEQFAVYMRFLGAPLPSTTLPGGAASITRGQQAFNSVGCSMCHTQL